MLRHRRGGFLTSEVLPGGRVQSLVGALTKHDWRFVSLAIDRFEIRLVPVLGAGCLVRSGVHVERSGSAVALLWHEVWLFGRFEGDCLT